MDIAATAMIIVLLVAMAAGLEITWALGLSCVVAVLLDPKLTFVVVAQRIFAGPNSFTMLAIPAFMLAGDIMSKGGLSKRLVSFADSLVGWISGGISLVSIAACTFFAAISGSSVATTSAIGGLMYPEMVERKYPPDYAAAVQAIGGTLGIVIPPSIVLVIYGNITETDVDKLLMAGILPGIVCCIFLCIYAYFKAKKNNFPKSDNFSFKEAIWALIIHMLNEFIEKVVVHVADKSTGDQRQKVDIYFNFIGCFVSPKPEVVLAAEEEVKARKALAARNLEREQNKRRSRRVRETRPQGR